MTVADVRRCVEVSSSPGNDVAENGGDLRVRQFVMGISNSMGLSTVLANREVIAAFA